MSNIYIPTFGRPKVKTLETLPRALLKLVVLVVDSDKTGRALVGDSGATWVNCPVQGTGAAKVRTWLLNRCLRHKEQLCIMFDDDVRFTVAHFEEGRKRFRKPSDPQKLVDYFWECVDRAKYPEVGMTSFSQTFFNDTKNTWCMNKDNAATFFINLESMKKSKAAFDRATGDVSFMCKTIASGYQIWAHSMVGVQKIGEHRLGGENAVSNRGKRHAESLKELAAMYPKYIILKKTTNPKYIENYGTDVTVVKRYAAMWNAVQQGKDVSCE